MIRVNLLESARPASTAVRARRQRTAWIGFTSMFVATLASGLDWWSVRREGTRLEQEIALAEADLGGLRATAREAAAMLARKTELDKMLAAMTKAQADRSAPVRLLAAVGESAPEDLWLTGVRQRGSQLEIEGRAMSLASVTDFAGRIQHAGVLTTPVEILSTSAEIREGTTLIRFSLRLD